MPARPARSEGRHRRAPKGRRAEQGRACGGTPSDAQTCPLKRQESPIFLVTKIERVHLRKMLMGLIALATVTTMGCGQGADGPQLNPDGTGATTNEDIGTVAAPINLSCLYWSPRRDSW